MFILKHSQTFVKAFTKSCRQKLQWEACKFFNESSKSFNTLLKSIFKKIFKRKALANKMKISSLRSSLHIAGLWEFVKLCYQKSLLLIYGCSFYIRLSSYNIFIIFRQRQKFQTKFKKIKTEHVCCISNIKWWISPSVKDYRRRKVYGRSRFFGTMQGSLNLNGRENVCKRPIWVLPENAACDWKVFVERLKEEVMETRLWWSLMLFCSCEHSSSSKKFINSVIYDAYMAELLLSTLLFQLFRRACQQKADVCMTSTPFPRSSVDIKAL